MKLSEIGFTLAKTSVILVGQPSVTSFMDSEDKPYYMVSLLNPVTVHCSTDPAIEPIETDVVYMRERDLDQDFTPVDANDLTKGYFMPKWVVDFSKGQELCLYQETTIKQWVRNNRKDRSAERTISINERLKAKAATKVGS